MKNHEEQLVIDGIVLKPKDDDERAWTYVPPRPSLERTASGAPMLQVIQAGATAFLQSTARVALDEDVRAALLARLKAKKPMAETLETAPLAVERIALEIKSGYDWEAVAESTSSGMPPWTAALAATLDAEALAAIRSAVAGEKQCARLTARIVLPNAPASFRRAEAKGEASIETSSGIEAASFSATVDASSPADKAITHELVADLSDFFPKSDSNH